MSNIKELLSSKDPKIRLAALKEMKKNKCPSTTVTSVTLTTTVTLHPGGGYENSIGLVYEPIGELDYLFKLNEMRGIAKAYFDKELKRNFIKIGNNCYPFKGSPITTPFFRLPNRETLEDYISYGYSGKKFEEIFAELTDIFKLCIEFIHPRDAVMCSLSVVLSWLRDYVNAYFFNAIDATKGAGKTSLLYLMSMMARHGRMAGDISTPLLARAIDSQKLTIFIDELDELPQDRKSELSAILRKSQRKGNPYARINPNTMEPEIFDVHGSHGYSYRKNIEDALSSRSFISRLKVSSDICLPIINYYIDLITESLHTDLFLYFFDNAEKFGASSYQVTEVTHLLGGTQMLSVSEQRKKIFEHFTSSFSKDEIELMGQLVGRNIELSFICLSMLHLLDFDAFESIKDSVLAKQSEEEVPESFYLDKLKIVLKAIRIEYMELWTLKKGEHEGCFYFPKNLVFGEFTNNLKGSEMRPISSNRFNGLLKDIGFIVGVNWKNQKDKEGNPLRCIIFDSTILKALGIKETD